MTTEERLLLLKKDLQLLTTANDDYLRWLLEAAASSIQREGIKLVEENLECDMVQIHYAAYLFRKRGGTDTAMPRFLRYELNNLLFSQKGGAL